MKKYFVICGANSQKKVLKIQILQHVGGEDWKASKSLPEKEEKSPSEQADHLKSKSLRSNK